MCMRMRLMTWIGFVLLMSTMHVAAQVREQVRQQAESQLRQMTPEEIERALKQYGMTIEEATSRAHSLGISLQDYLTRGTSSREERSGGVIVDPRLDGQVESAGALRSDTVHAVCGDPASCHTRGGPRLPWPARHRFACSTLRLCALPLSACRHLLRR